MKDLFNQTDDMGISMDEIPRINSTTSGLTSALQLVDTTNKIVLIEKTTNN